MTKDRLMTYTFFAVLILTIVTAAIWSTETTPSKWNLGLTVAISAIISVGIAVGLDALLHKVAVDSPLNIMSAAVFGLIVTDCYTFGVPVMRTIELFPLEAPQCFAFVAAMSAVGLIVFKKLVGLSGRKYVNPAAAAKLVVMIPFINTLLLAVDHMKSSALGVPAMDGPIGLASAVNKNGLAGFGEYMISCFSNANHAVPSATTTHLLEAMFLEQFHDWAGGASAIAVIIVGIGFFIVARKYVKWRITISYFVTTIIFSVIFSAVYGDTDYLVRLTFLTLIGASVFLAFFMATDPATTPLTYTGQVIFGVGVAILTVLMITFLQFFGASFIALIIMNLTVPALDRVGKLKPTTESKHPKLPKAQAFAPEKVKEYQCIRCGACMRACCHNLSPILIKQAFDKMNFNNMSALHADYCDGCGHCSFVCPSRIDLKGAVLRSKAMLRQQQ